MHICCDMPVFLKKKQNHFEAPRNLKNAPLFRGMRVRAGSQRNPTAALTPFKLPRSLTLCSSASGS